jgi:ABC-type dipeptide/oligopeptide/nickel transport system ATPase component
MLSTPTSAEIGGAPMAAPILTVSDLAIQFKLSQGWVTAVDGVDFELRRGEVVGIVGESGSGKSQILLAVMGLLACQRPVYRQRPVSGS